MYCWILWIIDCGFNLTISTNCKRPIHGTQSNVDERRWMKSFLSLTYK